MTQPIVDRLLAITSMFQQDMARSFAGTPLTEARVAVLWTLALSGPSTQQALAEALDVTPRNVSGLVDALEAHGYVQRSPHPADRRAVLVSLTTTGEQSMRRMHEEYAELESQLREAVPAEDLGALERGIDAIVERLTVLTAQTRQGADQ